MKFLAAASAAVVCVGLFEGTVAAKMGSSRNLLRSTEDDKCFCEAQIGITPGTGEIVPGTQGAVNPADNTFHKYLMHCYVVVKPSSSKEDLTKHYEPEGCEESGSDAESCTRKVELLSDGKCGKKWKQNPLRHQIDANMDSALKTAALTKPHGVHEHSHHLTATERIAQRKQAKSRRSRTEKTETGIKGKDADLGAEHAKAEKAMEEEEKQKEEWKNWFSSAWIWIAVAVGALVVGAGAFFFFRK